MDTIIEILTEHAAEVDGRHWCECGADFGSTAEHRSHVAAELGRELVVVP